MDSAVCRYEYGGSAEASAPITVKVNGRIRRVWVPGAAVPGRREMPPIAALYRIGLVDVCGRGCGARNRERSERQKSGRPRDSHPPRLRVTPKRSMRSRGTEQQHRTVAQHEAHEGGDPEACRADQQRHGPIRTNGCRDACNCRQRDENIDRVGGAIGRQFAPGVAARGSRHNRERHCPDRTCRQRMDCCGRRHSGVKHR